MKTVKQCNMMNREMKLVIGDELQTLFHPIVNVTKQAAEETRKELTPMKKTLMDIDGVLITQGATNARRPPPMNRVLQLGANGKTLAIDDTEYKLTPGLEALIMLKYPQPTQYNSNDYKA